MAKAVKDAGPGLGGGTTFGVAGIAFTSANQSGSAAAVTDAPRSGQKLVITDLIISVAAAMTVSFTEETSGDLVLRLFLPETSAMQITPRGKVKLAVANKRLMCQTDASGNISVLAIYYSEV